MITLEKFDLGAKKRKKSLYDLQNYIIFYFTFLFNVQFPFMQGLGIAKILSGIVCILLMVNQVFLGFLGYTA